MKRIAAVITVTLVTFLAALPWGLPAEYRLVLPLLPFLAIHFWTLHGIALVPEVLVFAAGLSFDFLSDGPLGYWALMYLTGYALTLAVAGSVMASSGPGRLLLLVGTLLSLVVVEVTLSALYFNAAADWWPPLVAATVAVLVYPALAALLRALAGPRPSSTGSEPAWGRDA